MATLIFDSERENDLPQLITILTYIDATLGQKCNGKLSLHFLKQNVCVDFLRKGIGRRGHAALIYDKGAFRLEFKSGDVAELAGYSRNRRRFDAKLMREIAQGKTVSIGSDEIKPISAKKVAEIFLNTKVGRNVYNAALGNDAARA